MGYTIPTMSTECNSQYLHSTLDVVRLRKVVKTLSKIIKRRVGVDNFDAIAYRGMSGAGVATTLGYLFGKPLVLVRKKGVESHSCKIAEGALGAKRILVVDDCIATGSTLVCMVRDMLNMRKDYPFYEGDMNVVAVLLYNDGRSRYDILPEMETMAEKFTNFINFSIASKEENRIALEAMVNMKVYSFRLDKVGKRYKTDVGTNLSLDDLK